MKWLIGCECSGQVVRAVRESRHGGSAYSADLKPAAPNYPLDNLGLPAHFQKSIFEVAGPEWEIMVAHPPCTYLSVSAAWAFKDGPYHQRVKPGTLVGAARRKARAEAFEFFMALWNLPIKRIALENPIGMMSSFWRPPDQIIQPYQFGDDASKATCLWLKNLPALKIDPAARVPGRIVGTNKRGQPIERWANQTDSGQNRLSPSESRAADRAVTYPGIARAMAEQWGGL